MMSEGKEEGGKETSTRTDNEKRDIQKFTKKREKSSNARTPGAKHHHHRSWIQRLLVWVPPDYDTTITMGILSRRQCLNFGH